MRTLLILLIGIVVGIVIARWDTSDKSARPPQSLAIPNTPAATAALAPPVITLRARGTGNLKFAIEATLVGNASTLIVPIEQFVGASYLVAETPYGNVPVTSVLAADERHGIAALATQTALDYAEVLLPAGGAGSLYLGREVALLDGSELYPAQIAGSGSRDELGTYDYLVKFFSSVQLDRAIIDPASRRLLGFLRASHSATTANAMDSEPVALLLDRASREQPRTLADYARHYFTQTTVGRLALIEQFVASGQFDSALQIGRPALNLDAYSQKHVAVPLRKAFAGAARQAADTSQWNATIALLNEADNLIGLDDDLRLLRAEAYQALGQLEAALSDLLSLDDGNANKVRKMVIENALSAGYTGDADSLALIQRALDSDPAFAPYHRLLAETLAKRGDMAGALAALERAITLDPTISAEVGPLLSRLRARRNTPPLTEVPIQRRGSTLYVTTRINGSTEVFRFLLDTGASYTAITSATALRLGINRIFFGAPVVELETANGRVFTTTATLSSIDVGGARVDNVEAVILERMSGVDGLLGQSFLRHFDVNIDRSRGVIAFNRRIDE